MHKSVTGTKTDIAEERQWRVVRRRIREDYQSIRRQRRRLGEEDGLAPSDPHTHPDPQGDHYNDVKKKHIPLPNDLSALVNRSNLAHQAAHPNEEPSPIAKHHTQNAGAAKDAALHAHKLGFIDLANHMAKRNTYARKMQDRPTGPTNDPKNPKKSIVFNKPTSSASTGEGVDMSLRGKMNLLSETVKIMREWKGIEKTVSQLSEGIPRPDTTTKSIGGKPMKLPTKAPRPSAPAAGAPEGPAQHLAKFHAALKQHGDVNHPEVQGHYNAAKKALGAHTKNLLAKGNKSAAKSAMGISNKLHAMGKAPAKKPAAPTAPAAESKKVPSSKSLSEKIAKLRKSLGKK
jgi:hypothetical protein